MMEGCLWNRGGHNQTLPMPWLPLPYIPFGKTVTSIVYVNSCDTKGTQNSVVIHHHTLERVRTRQTRGYQDGVIVVRVLVVVVALGFPESQVSGCAPSHPVPLMATRGVHGAIHPVLTASVSELCCPAWFPRTTSDTQGHPPSPGRCDHSQWWVPASVCKAWVRTRLRRGTLLIPFSS